MRKQWIELARLSWKHESRVMQDDARSMVRMQDLKPSVQLEPTAREREMWEVFFDLKCMEFTRLRQVFTNRGFDVVGFVPPSKILMDEPPWYWTNENKMKVRTSFREVSIYDDESPNGFSYDWSLLNVYEALG